MSTTFSELFRKAHGALANLRGDRNLFLGKNGEVIYSKNNVCVHEALPNQPPLSAPQTSAAGEDDDGVIHTPGYLTIRCQNDEQLGVTLVLQWLPNATLERNPGSIRCVSPHSSGQRAKPPEGSSGAEGQEPAGIEQKAGSEPAVPELSSGSQPRTGMQNDELSAAPRPSSFKTSLTVENGGGCSVNGTCTGVSNGTALGVPSINVIPNTPVADCGRDAAADAVDEGRRPSESSGSTSGADELSDEDLEAGVPNGVDGGDEGQSSAYDSDEDGESRGGLSDDDSKERKAANIEKYRKSCETMMNTIPEQFAKEHNMIMDSSATSTATAAPSLTDSDELSSDVATARLADGGERVVFRAAESPNSTPSNAGRLASASRPLFSANLGKMRSMRIFYSNAECTSGQLVLASPDSHYKILHFHHGGLDKLARLFGHWNAVKAKSVNEGSPSPAPDHQLLICQPAISRTELDPEDGLYNRVNAEFWRSYRNGDGSIDDPFTAIYFASIDATLRREIWPFLLHVYPWASTFEQRDAIYNQRFLAYQRIKRTRLRRFAALGVPAASVAAVAAAATPTAAHRVEPGTGTGPGSQLGLLNVASTIAKDVVRTDRRNPFFAGDGNDNLETMNAILLNYAVAHPQVGYVQGMSDLLAPLLATLRDEPLTYACFLGLMRQTLFYGPAVPTSTASGASRDRMEDQLAYLKELLRLLAPEFHAYVVGLGGDAPQLMFVHRWILLFFKREFPDAQALHIWEACWAKYRTSYFHLFVCAAIVVIYGDDIIAQRLPHDEILLYFSSLAMHMDADVVLKKARGLLYHFYRLARLPCTLAGLCDEPQDDDDDQWSSHRPQRRIFDCAQDHEGAGPCPYAIP